MHLTDINFLNSSNHMNYNFSEILQLKSQGSFYKSQNISNLELCSIWQLYISNEENYSLVGLVKKPEKPAINRTEV